MKNVVFTSLAATTMLLLKLSGDMKYLKTDATVTLSNVFMMFVILINFWGGEGALELDIFTIHFALLVQNTVIILARMGGVPLESLLPVSDRVGYLMRVASFTVVCGLYLYTFGLSGPVFLILVWEGIEHLYNSIA